MTPQFRPILILIVLSLVAVSPATASASGVRDFSWSAPSVNGPTAHKPQSKLWFNDGMWWGYLFDRVSESWHIYRLDPATQQWTDTGTAVDTRNATWADVLWDGGKLYVASAGASATNSSDSARLYRLNYNAATKTYSMDAGFPSTIVSGGMEAVVIDKDTTGKLWATWTRGSRVYVNDSTPGGATWGTPFIVPVAGTSVDPDDIATVIRFSGQIGVMWSNQVEGKVYFATHADGAARTDWQPSNAVLSGTKFADDHLNVRALEADSAGRVFAVVKTSLNDVRPVNPDAPQFVLLRLGLEGNWRTYTVSRVRDNQTRPVLVLDDQNRQLHVFATTSTNGATIDSGTADTAIYVKSTSLDAPSFATGTGTSFIELPTDKRVNDVTASKQNVNSSSGLLIEASDNASKFYLHNSVGLGPGSGTPPPPPPAPGLVFADGFESGNFSAWTSALTGGDGTATVQQAVVRTGSWAARLTESGNAGSFARVRRSLGAAYGDATIGLDVRVDAQGAAGLVVPIVRVYDPGSVRFFSLYRRNGTGNGVGVSHSGTSFDTGGLLPLGVWRHYDVRLVTAGAAAGTLTVSQDGTQIYSTTTATLPGGGSATIQIGNENAAQAFTLAVDGVQVTGG